MKKRILGLTVLALSALSLASCGGTNSTPIDKGSSVDSITFKNNKNEDVTIKKTDSYKEMISKLDSLQYIAVQDENGGKPFKEKYSYKKSEELTNVVSCEVEKDSDGDIVPKYDSYTTGTIKTTRSIDFTQESYDYLYECLFTMTDIDYKLNEEYDLKSGKVSSNKNDSYNNQGLYLNFTGDYSNGGSIEVATTAIDSANMLYSNSDSTIDLEKDHKSTYFKGDYNASGEEGNYDELMNEAYKASDKDITFRPRSINYLKSYASSKNPSGYDWVVADIIDDNYISSNFKDYYDLSFELTDKYIVIKNKFNTDIRAASMYDESGETTNLTEFLKPFEGSYSYMEVWLDYNNIFIGEEIIGGIHRYSMGYAYYKYDNVQKVKNEYVYTEDDTSRKETLEELGLIGKTATNAYVDETHIEVSLLDISRDEINNKKNEFINKCKNNNFLTEYNFSKMD